MTSESRGPQRNRAVSKKIATVDALVPESSEGFLGGGNPLRDREGQIVYSSNLTPDPAGLGERTEADFHRTLKLGLRPDGRPMHAPRAVALRSAVAYGLEVDKLPVCLGR